MHYLDQFKQTIFNKLNKTNNLFKSNFNIYDVTLLRAAIDK